ncbi:hypothetical protein C8R46DRAFT_1189298 [Mycena filopes]|nr:hypothetical protein C8R46DRAFT_1189298 [Mycena filopes]
MLSQMPTSALSFLSSSSKGLDGFFGLISVGIQMALTVVLAEFNTEFTTAVRATATVKLVLQPTKCVISNGTGFHPYVATMGSATLVLLVVSYMLLRAKGHDIGDGDPASPPSADIEDPNSDSGGQPPSPPEDPDTESSPRKCRNRWALFLLVILVWTVLLSLGAALFIAYLVPTLRFPSPLQVLTAQTSRIIETCSAYGAPWASPIISLATGISLHGHRYTSLLLLAVASHLACIVLSFPTRRAHRSITTMLSTVWQIPTIGVLIPFSIMMAIPQLRWILLVLWRLLFLPTMIEINEMRLWISHCILGATGVYSIAYSCVIAYAFYCALPPDVRPLLWRFPFSLNARYSIRPFYWHLFYDHQDWKAAQKEAFATLVFGLRHAFRAGTRCALEVWSRLPFSQKFCAKSDEFTRGGDVGAENYSHLG